MSEEPLRLRIEVSAPPDALLMRAAIEARLDGRSFPPGPEDDVAVKVAAAVEERLDRSDERRRGQSPWR